MITDSVAPEPGALALDDYRAMAALEARNYDPIQDISPRQMLILLEVAQRTGSSLGLALATGEFESAKTWNDFVRPTIAEGQLGSATGVWQFIPSTFYRIIKRYGAELLAASAADASLRREPMDLGAGPFSDQQVRRIIQETLAGTRDADDEQLQLLRHNFTVLAFAKHYLSVDTGAKTPEEDYLFHFLGEQRGRQILALARGEARHTLSVAPAQYATEPRLPTGSGLSADRGREMIRLPGRSLGAGSSYSLAGKQAGLATTTRLIPRQRSSLGSRRYARRETRSQLGGAGAYGASRGSSSRPAIRSSPDVATQPRASSQWALPASSPVVTGNPGMFYRDASSKTSPYTWAEFLNALSQRVQAKQQPAMVRAKYGVGFQLKGGDMPDWMLDGEPITETVEFRYEIGGREMTGHTADSRVRLPPRLITGPLDAAETEAYKARLAELIQLGEDQPLSSLPPTALSALQHLGLLPPELEDGDYESPEIHQALQAFRKLIGKDAPDDPALANSLMPSERVALEIYDQRIARYAALQAAQRVAMRQGLDLMGINRLLKSHQQASRPHIATLQKALAEAGLQTQTQARKRTQPAHFDGIAGKLTQGALNQFQLRNGLRPTDGLLDPVTAAMLGLRPLGREIFLPPSGPQSPLQPERVTSPSCETPEVTRNLAFYHLLSSSR
ncbi:peptidoglycan-binding domain-containing protein [Halochromatium sp.]